MRIFYSHYLTDANHPAVQMVEQIAAELRRFDHQVHVHASSGISAANPHECIANQEAANSGTESRRSGTVKQWLKNKLWFAKAYLRDRKRIRHDQTAIARFAPDVVLARQDAYSLSVVHAALRAQIPVVTYADAPVAYESRTFEKTGRWHPPGFVESMERWGLQRSQAIITVSHPAAKRLSHYPQLPKIHVARNGVDWSQFAAVPNDARARIRHEFDIRTPIVAGFLGTFKPFHGVDRLQEIIRLVKHRPEVTWLLIGDGPERPHLEAAVPNDRVRFTGRQPASRMPELLSAIDIAVAPHGKHEGDFYFCPLKILEYIAAGCATVASDQGDIPNLLEHGKHGVIVDEPSPALWAREIERLIDAPSRREEIRIAAKSYAQQHLSWEHTAGIVERVLTDVLAGTLSDTETVDGPHAQTDGGPLLTTKLRANRRLRISLRRRSRPTPI